MTTSNVTTKICVDSIIAQLPHALPSLSQSDDARGNHWKRYSKTGKDGQPILRRFYADHLPILADVLEEVGGQLRVTFLPMWPWNQDQYNLSPDFDEDHFDNVDAVSLQQQNISAGQFVFSVGEDPQMGTYVAVCPEEYFAREQHMWDQHLGTFMEMLKLPFDISEEMEATFSIFKDARDVTGEEAIRMMAGAGFKVDNAFISFMNKAEASA